MTKISLLDVVLAGRLELDSGMGNHRAEAGWGGAQVLEDSAEVVAHAITEMAWDHHRRWDGVDSGGMDGTRVGTTNRVLLPQLL